MKYHKALSLLSFSLIALLQSSCSKAPEESLQTPNSLIAAADTQNFDRYLSDLTSRHIQPNYMKLAESFSALQTSINTVCEGDALASVNWQQPQKLWLESMTAWQAINWFKLGPINQKNRHSRIQFWPDTNDAVNRGVNKLLTAKQTLSEGQLANFNMGAQGLPALEKLLFEFSTQIEVTPKHRCAIASSVVANLVTMSKETQLDWDTNENGFAESFTKGTGGFNNTKDAVEELVSNWSAQFILILDNKINYPLSFTAPGVPQIAESPFADASMVNLQTNIETFELIFTANNGFGLDDILIQQSHQKLSADITKALMNVKASVKLLPSSFTKTIAEDQSRKSLEKLVLSLRDLQLLIVDMVDKLNLNLGFNSLDGD